MRREREDTPTSPRPSPPLIHIPQAPGARSARLALAPRGAWGAERENWAVPTAFPLRPSGGGGQGEAGPSFALLSPAPATPYAARTTHFPRPRPFRRGRLGRAGLEIRAHDPTGVRDPACPAESHLSHLIPLNPGESRFEKVAGFPRASCTLTCARAIGQGERTALEGCESLPGVRCARTGPALQSSRRCGLGGPCDRPNDGTVGPRRRTVEAPWRCGSARSSRKPASCIEE